MSDVDVEQIAFGYTVATGRLFLPFARFHELAERLLGRPIWTHQFGDRAIMDELVAVIEGRGGEL